MDTQAAAREIITAVDPSHIGASTRDLLQGIADGRYHVVLSPAPFNVGGAVDAHLQRHANLSAPE